MKTVSRATAGQSIWAATAETPDEPSLKKDTSADVCVVGAGIAGLSAAYLLTTQGRKVVVLDDGPVAGGQTEVTTAHLASALDDRYFEIERLHGEEGARLAAESHSAAIDRIESIVAGEEIDCDFHRLHGYLFVPPGQSTDVLDRELEVCRKIGALQVSLLARVPGWQFHSGPCLDFANQGRFHPLEYLSGVAKAIMDRGGEIHNSTHVKHIDSKGALHVETENGPVVTARDVIVATNTPINDMFALHTKQAPYITYVIGAPIPEGALPDALYWDTADPYHYVRLQEENDGQETRHVLIVGGEDHKTGQADDGDDRFLRLEAWARERFPFMRQVEYRWSGQVMETVDGLAFIGRNPLDNGHVYVVTGDSGMGMTHGTIGGMLLTDLIVGRDNPWAKLYDPTRKPLGALGTFAKENLNVAAQYAAWLTPGEVSSVEEVARGQGAVMRRGMTKVAVYRDKSGKISELSAVCPHLKCIVAWNSAESTWDCPCHGSRFDAHGKVLNGPSNIDLPPAEKEK